MKLSAEDLLSIAEEHWKTEYHDIAKYTVFLYRIKEFTSLQTNEVTQSFGLSGTEFDVMATLRSSATPHIMTPTEVINSMLISSAGLAKILQNLEKNGWIIRSIGKKDKRSKLVHLTKKGKRHIEKAMNAVLKFDNEWLTQTLTDKEFKQYFSRI